MASKKTRAILFDKYDGKCAYCGFPLLKGWHVDEILPVKRNFKYVQQKGTFVWDGTYQHPERMTISNQNPSCPSCNINKHDMSLEQFRSAIKAYMQHLNEISTQYKIAKRYGLVIEQDVEVIFHFEKVAANLTEDPNQTNLF